MRKRIRSMFFVLLALLIFGTGCASSLPQTGNEASGFLTVHFLDVGQADCALLQFPAGEDVLIDAGNRADAEFILEYLEEAGVDHLDAVVATHPHEDHIGAMADILRAVETDVVFLPAVDADTNVYTNLLYAMEETGAEEMRIDSPQEISLGGMAAQFLTPLDTYDDLNNASLVLRLSYGETVFLFTGDIEKEAEEDLVESGFPLKADVLKVPHHGSDTSNTEAFLRAVSPQVAVVSVGADNDYGLPNDGALTRLSDAGAQVLRTDEEGTIVIKSDGTTIALEDGLLRGEGETEKAPKQEEGAVQEGALAEEGAAEETVIQAPAAAEEPLPDDNKTEVAPLPDDTKTQAAQPSAAEGAIIGNKNSKVYHNDTCSSLPKEENRVYFDSPQEAQAEGYRACSRCGG